MSNHKFGFTRGVTLSSLLALGACTTLLVGVQTPLLAQSNTTGLSGTVVDPSGASLAGVTVSIMNPATGTTQTTVTKSKGEYTFSQLTPGDYEVHVIGKGFAEQVQSVKLLIATPVTANFSLTVGTTEIINVETSLASINSTDGTLGKAFDSAQVQNLPYLANNVTYLLSLQPGVLALDSGAQTGGLNTDVRTGIVNGARQDQTNVTLDGVDNNDLTNGYAFNGALRSTRDSVEEFRVTTTNGGADAGRSSGGQVSLLTRSGTNQFHGSAYEYYRSSIGLQNNWYLKQSQLSSGKPNIPAKVLQHTYGASFGAPIIKDKLFFFGAYEGFKQASGSVVSQVVPSTIGGGGLITGTVTYATCGVGNATTCASPTYKTLSGADIASLDTKCTAAGTCPNGPGVDAAAVAYFKTFPLANTPGTSSTADGYNTGLYTFTSPLPLHQITNIAKLDYNLTPHQSLFVRGNLQSDNQSTALQFPGLPAASSIYGNNKGIAAGHIWNIGSSLSNNLRYGYIRQGAATRGTGSQPYVSFSEISTITATTTSTVYFITTNNFTDDLTWSKGHHTIQVGVNDRLLYNSRYFDSPLLTNASVSATLLASAAIAGTGGSFDAGAGTCANCAPVASSFKTYYNAAIIDTAGVIESGNVGTEYKVQGGSLVPAGAGVVPTHTYKNWEQEYYIQDQWKATPRLTITAGLRYTYLGVPYEKNGQQIAPTANLNSFLQSRAAAAAAGTAYTTRIAFQASGSANNAPNFWTAQKANFAPRIAFAYATADNRTSIRGGFALAYDHLGEGVIDQYESTSSSLLSLSRTNQFSYKYIDTNPRFTGYHNVPLGSYSVATLPLPYTPADNPFTFLRSINANIKTPYAETFNLSLQHEVVHNMTVTASYVGRLGRHVIQNLDVAQPTNLLDTVSGQTYYQAATAFDKMIDAGVKAANVPDSGYFHNMFPNASYAGYKGAQAYYAYLAAGDRGNETDPLFNWDTDPTASPAGQSFRFFFPQTSSIFAQSSVGTSNYHALQLSMRQVVKYGIEYDVNYTFSKSMDQGSSPERSFANLLHNSFNPAGDYAVSDFDARHNLTANYMIGLPFGMGKPFLNGGNGIIERIVGGWQLSGTVHYSTGFPFSAVATSTYGTNFDSSSYMVKTAAIPTGGHRYVGGSSPYETALKGITGAQAIANLRFAYAGEVGRRNDFRADGYFSMDDGMSKSFKTFGKQAFKISAEVFNVTGTPRFNNISTNGTSTNFGKYSASSSTVPGNLTQPRQMQFSGKYIF
ncbi:Carboxypeptidase regulatory-like domain-containing protein [Granulicella rosea]|uniref:Carboxypeptidase regulatory-like domain-containing protein n=1 Tax=Granulicella rosea TaxID=474952 RepID=A0A239M061_9BACT|nr:carboxypeptidase-like regulatory domain-containing protein [Granulicella rosea]SNT35324.1 Carboxypeptidase regulatory-like domain-containing protein [Granulicella rosea]